jgi:hypothetical protein
MPGNTCSRAFNLAIRFERISSFTLRDFIFVSENCLLARSWPSVWGRVVAGIRGLL